MMATVIHCPLCGAAGVLGLIRPYISPHASATSPPQLECGRCRWIWDA